MIELDTIIADKLAGIRLVLMDIDGTLISTGAPSFSNVPIQLRKLKPLNIGFSVATGRTIHGASFVTKQLQELGSHLPPMITYNGAVVLAGKDSSVVRRRLIQRADFEAVIECCRRKSLDVLAYACGAQFDFVPRETVYSEGAPRPGSDFNGMEVKFVSDLAAVDDDFVAALVDVPSPKAAPRLLEELNELLGSRVRVTTSGGRYIEICHTLGTKLNAMAELARRSVDLIERPRCKWIDLHGIDVAVAGRLHAGCRVGLLNALAWVAGFRLRLGSMQWLELSGERQQFWNFDYFDWFWRIGKLDGRLCVIVIGNARWRLERNGATRDHRDRKEKDGQSNLARLLHCQNSFDQSMALT